MNLQEQLPQLTQGYGHVGIGSCTLNIYIVHAHLGASCARCHATCLSNTSTFNFSLVPPEPTMSDPELDAIRRARLAELRGNGMSMSSSGAMPVGQTPGMASGDDSGEKAAQVDEMKRQMLSQILDSEARERRTFPTMPNQSISHCSRKAAESGCNLGYPASHGPVWTGATARHRRPVNFAVGPARPSKHP